jgi:hypothetical protein
MTMADAKKDTKKKTKKPFRISRGTIITIIVIIAVFIGWNLMLPRLFKVEEIVNVTLPSVKRGNIEFVDNQVQNRALTVPPLTAPQTDIGKPNPFE